MEPIYIFLIAFVTALFGGAVGWMVKWAITSPKIDRLLSELEKNKEEKKNYEKEKKKSNEIELFIKTKFNLVRHLFDSRPIIHILSDISELIEYHIDQGWTSRDSAFLQAMVREYFSKMLRVVVSDYTQASYPMFDSFIDSIKAVALNRELFDDRHLFLAAGLKTSLSSLNIDERAHLIERMIYEVDDFLSPDKDNKEYDIIFDAILPKNYKNVSKLYEKIDTNVSQIDCAEDRKEMYLKKLKVLKKF